MPQNDKKRTAEEQIDENLKRVYGSIVDEQLPERFTTLLAQLKEQDESCASNPLAYLEQRLRR